MDAKYRIKKRLQANDPQKNHSSVGSPVKSISNKKTHNNQSDDKRFKSQIIKPTYVQTPSKVNKQQQNSTSYNRKTFSKLNIRSGTLELKKQHITISRTLPESQSLYSSVQLKSSAITPKQQNSINIKQEIHKFPHYVSKSYQMIETKKKLLEAKHNIKLGKVCPILESIEDSVNQDRAAFMRKMKLQLCKKGNYALIGYLQKDIDDSPEKLFMALSQSRDMLYKARNLPYLLSMQYKDPYTLQKQERIHKMEQIKRKLKAVRKNNLSSLSSHSPNIS